MQVRHALAIHDAPGDHHRQRQQEVAQRHVQTMAIERPPHEDPQLHRDQRTGEQHAENQPGFFTHAPIDLRDPFPVAGQADEQGHERQRNEHSPAEDFLTVQRGKKRRKVIQNAKQK
ncbi:hypothetical protein D3C87_1500900 [compost metagenome]